MKTSWLKWKPDWDSAADKYMKAGMYWHSFNMYLLIIVLTSFKGSLDKCFLSSTLLKNVPGCFSYFNDCFLIKPVTIVCLQW